ncbi:MAG: hypothetical protein ACKVP4_06540 [Hyphomicrobium sp.]
MTGLALLRAGIFAAFAVFELPLDLFACGFALRAAAEDAGFFAAALGALVLELPALPPFFLLIACLP